MAKSFLPNSKNQLTGSPALSLLSVSVLLSVEGVLGQLLDSSLISLLHGWKGVPAAGAPEWAALPSEVFGGDCLAGTTSEGSVFSGAASIIGGYFFAAAAVRGDVLIGAVSVSGGDCFAGTGILKELAQANNSAETLGELGGVLKVGCRPDFLVVFEGPAGVGGGAEGTTGYF
jgi:hypothetical protein